MKTFIVYDLDSKMPVAVGEQPPGSAFDLAKPPSPSLTHFRMMPDATRICQEKLPRR
jgi:hypothetical protein